MSFNKLIERKCLACGRIIKRPIGLTKMLSDIKVYFLCQTCQRKWHKWYEKADLNSKFKMLSPREFNEVYDKEFRKFVKHMLYDSCR